MVSPCKQLFRWSTSYEVQYGTVASGNFSTIYTDNATPGATITGLTNGTAYQFRVVAKNAQGTGPASNVVTATPFQVIVPTYIGTVGVTATGNTITKTAGDEWGNGGAASAESFSGDGGISFTASQTGSYHLTAGLSSSNTNAHFNTIEYAIYLGMGDGRCYI